MRGFAAAALLGLLAAACQSGFDDPDSASFWLDNQSEEVVVITYTTTEAYGGQSYEQPVLPDSRIVLHKGAVGTKPSDVIVRLSVSLSNSGAAIVNFDPVPDGMWRADGKADLGAELTEAFTLVVTEDNMR